MAAAVTSVAMIGSTESRNLKELIAAKERELADLGDYRTAALEAAATGTPSYGLSPHETPRGAWGDACAAELSESRGCATPFP